jgi:selenide, water dikinase
VLAPLAAVTAPAALLVGLHTSDDAAVYRVTDDLAIVQTVDFFAPVVDDAYDYGAIAAANAMSDIYAMGGTVTFALNVAAWPESLSAALLARVFQGGTDAMASGGAVIAGGHTIRDEEPKYGLCVTGTVHPERIITKAAARPGDVLVLTKPLGTGAITTAAKNEQADSAHLAAAVASMKRLNDVASRLAVAADVRAGTDITGFGLLGHADEIAAKSGVGLIIASDALPWLDGAREYARRGVRTGGNGRNRDYFSAHVTFAETVPDDVRQLMWESETSGGLLLCINPEAVDGFMDACTVASQPAWRIGAVTAGAGITVQ